jgi:hypothetical protein
MCTVGTILYHTGLAWPDAGGYLRGAPPTALLVPAGGAGLDALLQWVEASHQAYDHVKLSPVLLAANEATSTTFALLEYELRNIGPIAGAEPTGR